MSRKQTILLIENQAPLRRSLVSELQAGYDVLVCQDGVDGVKTYERHLEQIAAVVTELETPRIKGNFIAEWIHHIKPELPIIILTTRHKGVGLADMFHMTQDPEVELLQKPIKANELLALLHKAINKVHKEKTRGDH